MTDTPGKAKDIGDQTKIAALGEVLANLGTAIEGATSSAIGVRGGIGSQATAKAPDNAAQQKALMALYEEGVRLKKDGGKLTGDQQMLVDLVNAVEEKAKTMAGSAKGIPPVKPSVNSR